MKHDPKAITAALDLYFKGVSQRKIVHHLRQFYGVSVTQPCIVKWLRKYVTLVREYADQLIPQTSGILHVDEMKVNVNGRLDWLWNLMDSDTRFWVSSMISQRREVNDARAVFQDAKQKLSVMPAVVTHDGLQSYGEAFKREFYTNTMPRPIEVRSVSIRDRGFNNRVERLNQTFRDRNKTQRGLDHSESAQLMADGTRIEYNFIRPHMTLKGKTPAEACGIGLEGKNKWLTLIQKASQK
jgi:transposase-like protein